MARTFSGVCAVLFDLDGTLADSAPDLGGAANTMRIRRGLDPLPLEQLRPFASQGARGLVGAAFEVFPGHASYEQLRLEFLDTYQRDLCVHTGLFDGIVPLLDGLEARGITWGIVTNKAARFTSPLVERLGLATRARAVVSGDTTPHSKPHPAPLLHAAAIIGIDPRTCIYVGDDLRDIEAGRAANMGTIAAAWGYCAKSDPGSWSADITITHPGEMLALID